MEQQVVGRSSTSTLPTLETAFETLQHHLEASPEGIQRKFRQTIAELHSRPGSTQAVRIGFKGDVLIWYPLDGSSEYSGDSSPPNHSTFSD